MSWNGPLLISAATRLQGIFFWDLSIYLIEGFVFLITGLQARTLIEKAKAFPIRELLVAIALTTAIVIVARFVWVFPATYLPRWLSPRVWRARSVAAVAIGLVIAFTGVRGVVSLAAALAIPLTLPNGAPFPHRDLILLATFGVIIITLVGKGLTLPFVVKLLGVSQHGHGEALNEREAEIAARRSIHRGRAGRPRHHHRRTQAARRPRQVSRGTARNPDAGAARSATRGRRTFAGDEGSIHGAGNHRHRAHTSAQAVARGQDHRRNPPPDRTRSRPRRGCRQQPGKEYAAVIFCLTTTLI